MNRPSAAPACLLALVLLAPVLLAGCGTAYPTAPEGTPSPISTGSSPFTSMPSSSVAPAPSGPSAEIEIDITGGPHAGSYRAVGAEGCDNNPAQNEFSVAYSDDAAADGFVALHLVLRDAAMAIQDESDDFLAQISVGGAGAGISYTIDPPSGSGNGSALLETSPFDATLDLSAEAPDGSVVELYVTCDFS